VFPFLDFIFWNLYFFGIFHPSFFTMQSIDAITPCYLTALVHSLGGGGVDGISILDDQIFPQWISEFSTRLPAELRASRTLAALFFFCTTPSPTCLVWRRSGAALVYPLSILEKRGLLCLWVCRSLPSIHWTGAPLFCRPLPSLITFSVQY
jgi:hypothetical protein